MQVSPALKHRTEKAKPLRGWSSRTGAREDGEKMGLQIASTGMTCVKRGLACGLPLYAL